MRDNIVYPGCGRAIAPVPVKGRWRVGRIEDRDKGDRLAGRLRAIIKDRENIRQFGQNEDWCSGRCARDAVGGHHREIIHTRI